MTAKEKALKKIYAKQCAFMKNIYCRFNCQKSNSPFMPIRSVFFNHSIDVKTNSTRIETLNSDSTCKFYQVVGRSKTHKPISRTAITNALLDLQYLTKDEIKAAYNALQARNTFFYLSNPILLYWNTGYDSSDYIPVYLERQPLILLELKERNLV